MTHMLGAEYDGDKLSDAYRRAERAAGALQQAAGGPRMGHDPWSKAFMEVLRPGISQRMQQVINNNTPGAMTTPKLMAMLDAAPSIIEHGIGPLSMTEYQDQKLAYRVSKAMKRALATASRASNPAT